MLKKTPAYVWSLCFLAVLLIFFAITMPGKLNRVPGSGPFPVIVLDGRLFFILREPDWRLIEKTKEVQKYATVADKHLLVIDESVSVDPAIKGDEGDLPALVEKVKAGLASGLVPGTSDKQIISETTENVMGLKVHHMELGLEADYVIAVLLATANKKVLSINLVSRRDDKTGHTAVLNTILGRK